MLKNIIPANWSRVFNHFRIARTKRIKFNNTVDVKGNAISKTTSLGGIVTPKQGEPLSRIGSVQPPTNPDTDPPGSCGVYVTTKDAYTLTDGPTIFLANDLSKIAKFLYSTS